ncbi:MAG: hypothetical protein CVV27_06250, partial [Candidatus Melainabacteria bacterium HGW-Melainabacteria-1]
MTVKHFEKVEKYQLIEEIGRGGSGVVYLAQDTRLQREVALKQLLLPAYVNASEQEALIERFYREAQTTARFQHLNIMQIYDVFDADSQHYIAMELLDRRTLRDYCSVPDTTLGSLLEILTQTATGLEYAHQQGVIHRDIKPENVIVSFKGVAKIMDFGVAKRQDLSSNTVDGSILGTIGYMSPEQLVNSKAADVRGDVYSFGAMVYHLLTGELPFAAEGLAETIRRIFQEPLRLPHVLTPGIPAALSAVIAQALCREPEQRYASMQTLANDLMRVRDMLPPNVLQAPLSSLLQSSSSEQHLAPETAMEAFREFGLIEVLIAQLEAKFKGCMQVRSATGLEGGIFLSDGLITAIELPEREIDSPLDRLYEIICWEAGRFRMRPLDEVSLDPIAAGLFAQIPADLMLMDLFDCRSAYRDLHAHYADRLGLHPNGSIAHASQSVVHSPNLKQVLAHSDGTVSLGQLLNR